LGFENPLCSRTQVEIVFERFGDKTLQNRVLKDGRPSLIAE
jgi:hypothetical protein